LNTQTNFERVAPGSCSNAQENIAASFTARLQDNLAGRHARSAPSRTSFEFALRVSTIERFASGPESHTHLGVGARLVRAPHAFAAPTVSAMTAWRLVREGSLVLRLISAAARTRA
jgi:hypothetical protein